MERHAWAARQTQVGSAARWVLWEIADHADPSGLAYPKLETIAEHLEQHPETVGRHAAALVAFGLVDRVRIRKGDGNYGGWVFRVLVPGSCAVDPNRLPRIAGDLELPTSWLRPLTADHPTELSGDHPTELSGQEPLTSVTANPEDQDPRSDAAARRSDSLPEIHPRRDPQPADPELVCGDYRDNPWRAGRRLADLLVDRVTALRLIADEFTGGDERAAIDAYDERVAEQADDVFGEVA